MNKEQLLADLALRGWEQHGASFFKCIGECWYGVRYDFGVVATMHVKPVDVRNFDLDCAELESIRDRINAFDLARKGFVA